MRAVIFITYSVILMTVTSYVSIKVTAYRESIACASRVLSVQYLCTNREKQEIIHDILGKYRGDYEDNDSYDYNSINDMFMR